MNEQEVHVCSLVLGAWLKKKFGTSTIYSRIGLRVSWDFRFQAGCPKSQLWDLRTWWNHARNVSELTDETNVKFWNLNYFVFAKCFTYLNEEMQSSKVVIVKSVHIIISYSFLIVLNHRHFVISFGDIFLPSSTMTVLSLLSFWKEIASESQYFETKSLSGLPE